MLYATFKAQAIRLFHLFGHHAEKYSYDRQPYH